MGSTTHGPPIYTGDTNMHFHWKYLLESWLADNHVLKWICYIYFLSNNTSLARAPATTSPVHGCAVRLLFAFSMSLGGSRLNQCRADLEHDTPATPRFRSSDIQGGPKPGSHRLMTIILSNLNRFKKIDWKISYSKFAVKWILKIPPHPVGGYATGLLRQFFYNNICCFINLFSKWYLIGNVFRWSLNCIC